MTNDHLTGCPTFRTLDPSDCTCPATPADRAALAAATAPAPADLFGLDDDVKWKRENRARERGLESCTHCGRGVQIGKGWVTVVLGGGSRVRHPDAVTPADEADSGFMGAWLLGPTCAKGIPTAARARWNGWN